jgi:hypothetical protein
MPGVRAEQRDERAPLQLIELHSVPCQPGPRCRISNWQRLVSGHAGILQPVLVLPTLVGDCLLHIRHDERADRAMFAAVPKAYVAMVVLTRLHLLTLEQVAGRDVKPARTRLHQQSMLPQQANGYQECASAGMAATSAATISNVASGHTAAASLSIVMNSRRFIIRSPRRRGRAASAAPRCRARESNAVIYLARL